LAVLDLSKRTPGSLQRTEDSMADLEAIRMRDEHIRDAERLAINGLAGYLEEAVRMLPEESKLCRPFLICADKFVHMAESMSLSARPRTPRLVHCFCTSRLPTHGSHDRREARFDRYVHPSRHGLFEARGDLVPELLGKSLSQLARHSDVLGAVGSDKGVLPLLPEEFHRARERTGYGAQRPPHDPLPRRCPSDFA
jgi:hypothetical protein